MKRTGHTHMTRDIKDPGVCPACDRSRQKIVGVAGIAAEKADEGVKLTLRMESEPDEEFAITLDQEAGAKHLIEVMRALGLTTAFITDGAGVVL